MNPENKVRVLPDSVEGPQEGNLIRAQTSTVRVAMHKQEEDVEVRAPAEVPVVGWVCALRKLVSFLLFSLCGHFT